MVRPADFTGTPFIAGSIRGERCWSMTADYRLHSPAQRDYVWGSGENIALCNYSQDRPSERAIREGLIMWFEKQNKTIRDIKIYMPSLMYLRGSFPASNYDMDAGVRVTYETSERYRYRVPNVSWAMGEEYPASSEFEIERIPGEVKQEFVPWYQIRKMFANMRQPCNFETCVCGFYAYLQGQNEYLKDQKIVGVIEGYGETLIGKFGFRSQKAKILALAPVEPMDGVKRKSRKERKKPANPEDFWVTNDDYGILKESLGNYEVKYSERQAQRQLYMYSNLGLSYYAIDWDFISLRYPDAVIFKDPAVMRAEFPATNVKEFL